MEGQDRTNLGDSSRQGQLGQGGVGSSCLGGVLRQEDDHSERRSAEYSLPSDEAFPASESTQAQSTTKTAKRKYYRKKTDKVQRWTQEECDLYEHFIDVLIITTLQHLLAYNLLKENLENYVGGTPAAGDKTGKRNKKNFILMSEYISSKTPCQCRSHHQKFFKKTLDKILLTKEDKQDETYLQIQESIRTMQVQKKRIRKHQELPREEERRDELLFGPPLGQSLQLLFPQEYPFHVQSAENTSMISKEDLLPLEECQAQHIDILNVNDSLGRPFLHPPSLIYTQPSYQPTKLNIDQFVNLL